MAVFCSALTGVADHARADDFAQAVERAGSRAASRGSAQPRNRDVLRPSRPQRVAANNSETSRGPSGVSTTAAAMPTGPVVLVVSLAQQRMSVYSGGKLIETTKVSTGTASDPTPSGVFAVIEKAQRHFSNLYNGAPMPFMQRLTMSGVALHSGHVTGRPASHGCVRLPHAYSQRLFRMTQLGARVIISEDDPTPVDIVNMNLLEPARVASVATSERMTSERTTGEITTGGITTSSVVAPAPPAATDKSIDPRTGKPKGPLSLQRDEVLRAAPVSILVSRAEGRVYVRHMFEPQFDAEIAIAEPRRPLGTHVYTLTEIQPDGSGQRWSALTVKLRPRRTAAIRVLAGRTSRAARAIEPARTQAAADEGAASTSAEALDRFALPPEVVAQIAPLLRPGASLVVTDLPPSKRTQTGWTDVIVSAQ